MMRLALLAIAFAASSLAAAPVPKELTRLEKFDGTWTVESLVTFGQPSSENLLWTIDAEGNLLRHNPSVAATSAGRPIRLLFDRPTKALEWTEGTTAFVGRYRLSGDNLEICLAFQGGVRPKEVEAGPKNYLWTLRRSAAEAKK